MQLFHWSPTTLHSVWNAQNCDIYVLRKDLNKPGRSPYVLDDQLGDMPQSSIEINVTFTDGHSEVFKLSNYLSIQPPRTTRLDIMREMLMEQYPTLSRCSIRNLTIHQPHHDVVGPIRQSIDQMNATSIQERSMTMDRQRTSTFGGVCEYIQRESSFRFPHR